ncbi:DUF7619 domain-containing protein [Polaribacter butkevichii]|uniref:Uncharacterized protein n=1 Tax=Polaribacter butkevichii TaxID=218490 RepID=A0A2P6CC32_9FLAO|nr:T9SS type A sorting domain-containing protein [Polaribacter butkevichii]PQJ72408.1 hypothetical protein BTO14_03700 [Polaribacter butkevichii]
MKLKLLSIALFFISSTIFCQIVNIPDNEFKNVLLTYSPSIDTNNDNEIQVTEAAAVTSLDVSYHQSMEDPGGFCPDPNDPACLGGGGGIIIEGISDLTGIEAFINLTSLNCSFNDLTSLDVSALTQLTFLDCSNNINYNNFSGNFIGISNLTLPNTNTLNTLNVNNNNLASLDLTNQTSLTTLTANQNVLSSLDLSNQTSLTSAIVNNNSLTSLILTNTSLLQNLNCERNQLPALDISTSVALTTLKCPYNQINGIDATNNTALVTLNSHHNLINSLTLPTTSTLTHIYSSVNQITTLDASMATGLIEVSVYGNSLTSLTLPTTNTLNKLLCYQNNLTTLETSVTSGLVTLNASSNSLTSLTLPTTASLQTLVCNLNSLPSLNLSSSINLTTLNCNNNNLNMLDVSTNTSLTTLSCANNNLTALNTLTNTTLTNLDCSNNQITSLDTTTTNTLTSFICSGNLLTELDLYNFSSLNKIYCNNNLLTSLNLKNGNSNALAYNTFSTKNNANLNAICVDDALVAAGSLGNGIDAHTNFTEYCSFVPVNSNTITGTVSFDFNNDGCDAADTKSVNTRINTTSTNVSASSFSAADGTYTIHINDTDVTTELIPNFPSFFTATPTTQTTNFTGSGNTETINFCITANAQVDDVEVYSFTTSESRPGFDTHLRIFHKNNGSTIIPSGTVTLNFNENQEVFNNASTTPDTQTSNSLSWNYTNLQPFEENFIDVYFTINTPIDATNPVNGGDTISYTTTITPLTGDATPTDNSHIFSDIIVNAYDPNDVVCFEGDKISTAQVTNDLTYRIRFQNTGTASAINIVVKDIIDIDLDMATFTPIAASHSYRTAISNTNKVEFIFENIQLADSTSNEPASHGWIFYKIKPKNTAVIGDAFDTTANIYFDYNAPVITNTFNTTVSTETTIPDNNFEMALINAGLDDGTPDQKVFTDNINTITNLDVSNKNITDLTGINAFTALTTLNVSNNQLSTLDVSTHSLLSSLDAQSNGLTSLNVKNGNNTNFTLFNTINNPNLTCIEVDDAAYSTLNWTNIDTTSNFVNNQAACTALSTDLYNSLEFSLSPNPTNGKININSLEKATLIIYAITGKEIKNREIAIGKNEITNLNLAKGIYLFKLVSEDKSSTKKVIVN